MTALEAHLKLLALLPSRIHQQRPASYDRDKGGRPPPEHTRRLHAAILKLKAAGCSRQEIAKTLGVSLVTVTRHCIAG